MGYRRSKSASRPPARTDFDFVREIIEDGSIPVRRADPVLSQCRPELIERTFESVRGAAHVILHIYKLDVDLHGGWLFREEREGI